MRYAHTAPKVTPWRVFFYATATFALLLGATMVFAITGTGDRASFASGAGQFIVQCHEPVKVGTFDPIVFPGQPVAGHQHEFFGATNVNPNSTYLSLYRSATSCDAKGDTAAYWAPTLYSNGTRILPQRLTAYYNSKTTFVETFPPGLKMIAGNKLASAPQDTKVVYWGCGNGSGQSSMDHPPQCGSGDELTLHVIFPDCWNGAQIDSADHQSHMAYSSLNGGSCPAGHSHRLPVLTMRIEYGVTPDPRTLSLASGAVTTMHADFYNAWDVDRLDSVIDTCIRGGQQCSADEAIAAQGPAHPK